MYMVSILFCDFADVDLLNNLDNNLWDQTLLLPMFYKVISSVAVSMSKGGKNNVWRRKRSVYIPMFGETLLTTARKWTQLLLLPLRSGQREWTHGGIPFNQQHAETSPFRTRRMGMEILVSGVTGQEQRDKRSVISVTCGV